MTSPTGVRDRPVLTSLRARTASLHARLEQRTDLPASLGSGEDVAGLLVRWWSLASRLELLADDDVPSLLPAIGADLAVLGTVPPAAVVAGPTATTPAGRLGTAWVLLGARLGLASLATPVAHVVGRRLSTFDQHDTAPLRSLHARLEALDAVDADAAAAAASDAFTLAATTLGGPPWTQ